MRSGLKVRRRNRRKEGRSSTYMSNDDMSLLVLLRFSDRPDCPRCRCSCLHRRRSRGRARRGGGRGACGRLLLLPCCQLVGVGVVVVLRHEWVGQRTCVRSRVRACSARLRGGGGDGGGDGGGCDGERRELDGCDGGQRWREDASAAVQQPVSATALNWEGTNPNAIFVAGNSRVKRRKGRNEMKLRFCLSDGLLPTHERWRKASKHLLEQDNGSF